MCVAAPDECLFLKIKTGGLLRNSDIGMVFRKELSSPCDVPGRSPCTPDPGEMRPREGGRPRVSCGKPPPHSQLLTPDEAGKYPKPEQTQKWSGRLSAAPRVSTRARPRPRPPLSRGRCAGRRPKLSPVAGSSSIHPVTPECPSPPAEPGSAPGPRARSSPPQRPRGRQPERGGAGAPPAPARGTLPPASPPAPPRPRAPPEPPGEAAGKERLPRAPRSPGPAMPRGKREEDEEEEGRPLAE